MRRPYQKPFWRKKTDQAPLFDIKKVLAVLPFLHLYKPKQNEKVISESHLDKKRVKNRIRNKIARKSRRINRRRAA